MGIKPLAIGFAIEHLSHGGGVCLQLEKNLWKICNFNKPGAGPTATSHGELISCSVPFFPPSLSVPCFPVPTIVVTLPCSKSIYEMNGKMRLSQTLQ